MRPQPKKKKATKPEIDLSTPLATPELWVFRDREGRSSAGVEERTWYAARKKASLMLGCPVEDLECSKSPFVRGAT